MFYEIYQCPIMIIKPNYIHMDGVCMKATRAYREAFSAVMSTNESISGHVSCLLMYEQFCYDAENNLHLSWMCVRCRC